jgi:hypothetical protein
LSLALGAEEHERSSEVEVGAGRRTHFAGHCRWGGIAGRWRSRWGGGCARRGTTSGEDGRRRELLPCGRCCREAEVEAQMSFAGRRCFPAGGVAGRWRSRWGGGRAWRRTAGRDERRRRKLLPCGCRRREAEVKASTSGRTAEFLPSRLYPPSRARILSRAGFFPARARLKLLISRRHAQIARFLAASSSWALLNRAESTPGSA